MNNHSITQHIFINSYRGLGSTHGVCGGGERGANSSDQPHIIEGVCTIEQCSSLKSWSVYLKKIIQLHYPDKFKHDVLGILECTLVFDVSISATLSK